ncbi:MAG: tRNA (adenosine(37)-N6)-dimethylallyltransferase MiaA [Burkholderiaceae bacterium]
MSAGTGPVTMLVGPTASGKSAAAMAIARAWPIEIISMDSAQVYRGMDIGTAKPGAAERRAVVHHLIDLIDPADHYSAARFALEARALVGRIEARGRIPLIVGGTLLYARAFIDGLHDLPGADPSVRAALEAQAREQGWPALHARLAAIDPATAARLDPTMRSASSARSRSPSVKGRPMSAWLTQGPRIGRWRGRFACWRSSFTDRSVLHERIALRFRAMVEAGLLDEVRRLRGRGDLHAGLPSIRCVGYRQAWEWLDQDPPGPLEAMMERGIAATRQLAKRQLTWLRAMPARTVIDRLADDCTDQVLARFAQDHSRPYDCDHGVWPTQTFRSPNDLNRSTPMRAFLLGLGITGIVTVSGCTLSAATDGGAHHGHQDTPERRSRRAQRTTSLSRIGDNSCSSPNDARPDPRQHARPPRDARRHPAGARQRPFR